jgi:hypothetical protein
VPSLILAMILLHEFIPGFSYIMIFLASYTMHDAWYLGFPWIELGMGSLELIH